MRKILFICGSLEPGRDGVGDYTRHLAGELSKQGYVVAAVALHDQHIRQEYAGVEDTDAVRLLTLRLPSGLPSQQRFKKAAEWIASFQPEWISLQFVPYAYQKKGLPFTLSSHLAGLGKQYRWHVMFHELWLDKPDRVTQHFIALAQQFIIYRCIARLQPKLVNVSIPFNQQRLTKLGILSKTLGLFGNIPKNAQAKLPDAFKALDADTIKILYFGGAPRGNYLNQVVDGLLALCKRVKRNVAVVIVSGNSANKTVFIQTLQATLASYNPAIIDCGFMESDALSELISHCSVGIARSEPHLLGKSGAAIAMLEHGIPVWMPKWLNGEPLDFDFRKQLLFADLYEAAHYPERLGYQPLLPVITQAFISQLNSV